MKHYCNYHPISSASWFCAHCDIYYDNACVPEANVKMKSGTCPQCRKDLSFLDDQQLTTPFWLNVSRFFYFPLQAEPFLLITLSVLLALAYMSDSTALALLSTVITVLLVTHYGQQITKNATPAKFQPPGIAELFARRPLKKTLGLSTITGIAILVPTLSAHYFSSVLALFLVLVICTGVPALLLVKLRQKKHGNALTLSAIMTPLVRMKAAYSGLVGSFILAALFSALLIDFSQQHFSPVITPLISAAAFSYFGLVMFSMLSYVLLEYQSFSAPEDASAEKYKPRALHDIRSSNRLLDTDIDIACKQGNYDEVIVYLENELQRSGCSDLRRDQLFKLLLARNDINRLERHSHAFLWLMLSRGRIDNVVDLLQQLRNHNPKFKLFDLTLSKKLAEAFHKKGEHELVLWLASNAHTRFEPKPELAKLYLLAAKTLLRKFNDRKKADKYLNYITQNFPDEPIIESAKILQRLTQQAHFIK